MKRAMVYATALVMGLVLATPPRAEATPEFAKQWGSSCASCHIGAPTGLDEEGVAFKLAGYEMGIEPEMYWSKLFFSLVTDVVTFDSGEDDEVAGLESAELFTLIRLDKAGHAKIFAIGDLSEDENGDLDLGFAHGHLQVNPLEKRQRLNLRLGNVEPMTRLWNTDMRRVFQAPIWGGVDTGTGIASGSGGGHHAQGSSARPSVLPASDWGGDISSVIGGNLLVTGGAIKEIAYGGIFWKRGGRGFDNSTVPEDFDGAVLSPEERATFDRQQMDLAKKWERSVIFGLSAYAGGAGNEIFDSPFLAPEEHVEHEEEEEGHTEMPGMEGEDEHGDEHVEEHEAFMPTRLRDSSRLVAEMLARWNRYGFYLVGVYGDNDYALGDPEHWEEHGEFELLGNASTDFFAWALEGSASFGIDRRRVGRIAVRYESLSPEADGTDRFQRALANVTVPIRIMRPAIWPYLEVARDLVVDEWRTLVGVRLGY